MAGSKRQKQLAQLMAIRKISCTSMMVTLFGDVVSQHGGWIWLGSIIEALEPLGFSERLVRTATNRLMVSDWLTVNKVGRRSYYCFTENARSHYEKAARRIYQPQDHEWDGHWLLVMLVSVPEEARDDFRKSLTWQGFNTLSSGVYAHPSLDRRSLDEILIELGLINNVIVFSAETNDLNSLQLIKSVAKERWNFEELQSSYEEFLSSFRDWHKNFTTDKPSSSECFSMRLLLVHEYRRALLRDPDFPDEMLPHGWSGYEAYSLTKKTYKKLWKPSINYIQHELENAQGYLDAPYASFYERFGGLK